MICATDADFLLLPSDLTDLVSWSIGAEVLGLRDMLYLFLALCLDWLLAVLSISNSYKCLNAVFLTALSFSL